MKRSRKLCINLILIAIILFISYYLSGYYISKNACILDTVEVLYGKETEIIMEVEKNNHICTLVADPTGKTIAIVGTRKSGLFYCTASSVVNIPVDDTQKLYITSAYSTSLGGSYFFVYRNDKNIATAELTLFDGTTIVLDQWEQDFAGTLIDGEVWKAESYTLYDADGKIIY